MTRKTVWVLLVSAIFENKKVGKAVSNCLLHLWQQLCSEYTTAYAYLIVVGWRVVVASAVSLCALCADTSERRRVWKKNEVLVFKDVGNGSKMEEKWNG